MRIRGIHRTVFAFGLALALPSGALQVIVTGQTQSVPVEQSACRDFAGIAGRYEFYAWNEPWRSGRPDADGATPVGLDPTRPPVGHAVSIVEIQPSTRDASVLEIRETPLTRASRSFLPQRQPRADLQLRAAAAGEGGGCRFNVHVTVERWGDFSELRQPWGPSPQGGVAFQDHYGQLDELRRIED